MGLRANFIGLFQPEELSKGYLKVFPLPGIDTWIEPGIGPVNDYLVEHSSL